jgi:hypothetical protein
MPKETDMKTVMRFTLAALAIGAMLGMSGCTDLSSRNTLTVISVNEGNAYFSDLASDSLNSFSVDEVKVEFGNIRNGGGAPLEAGAPFSEIVVTGYTVTYDNGIFSPVTGGLNVRVASGGTSGATIILTNSGEKGSLTLSGTVTTIARIHFTGYNYINGYNNGEGVYADAALSVQVGDFGGTAP